MRAPKPQRMKVPNRDSRSRHLTVPSYLAERIDERTEFVPELTDEGVLFRVVYAPPPGPPEGPPWLVEGVDAEAHTR